MTHSEGKKKSIDSVSEKLDLAGKDIKAVIINMFKELKETNV